MGSSWSCWLGYCWWVSSSSRESICRIRSMMEHFWIPIGLECIEGYLYLDLDLSPEPLESLCFTKSCLLYSFFWFFIHALLRSNHPLFSWSIPPQPLPLYLSPHLLQHFRQIDSSTPINHFSCFSKVKLSAFPPFWSWESTFFASWSRN